MSHSQHGSYQSDDSATRTASRAETESTRDLDSLSKKEPHIPRHDLSDTEVVDFAHSERDPSVTDPEAVNGEKDHGPPYSIFTKRQKQYIVFMAAWGGFFSQLSTNIYFPALNVLSEHYRVSNELINLTITAYMIFQGLAPTIYGDLADMAGRRPAYIIGFVIYIGSNIGLALQNTYPALLILRCLQSSGSSGTIALGNGAVADIATSSERGIYIGLVMCGPMIGPAVGPILGGILAHFLGWRSIFWFLTILAGVFMIPFLITFPETGRNIVGNGSIRPQGWNMSLLNYLQTRKSNRAAALKQQENPQQEAEKTFNSEPRLKQRLRCPNPMKTISIIFEKDAGILLFVNSVVYTSYYCVIVSLPSLLAEIYSFNDLQIGLAFIPFGVGCTLASFLCGKLMDMNYKRVAKGANFTIDRHRGDDLRDFPLEKARIQVIWPLLYLGVAALLCYGWVLQKDGPLVAPIILTFIMGVCLTGVFDIISTVLVDMYPNCPSTATAANNLARCSMGAGGTAVIIQMIGAMGRGWCFTFIAAVVAASSPLLIVVLKCGPRWREERRLREVAKHTTSGEQ
ncbi:MAG: hypothetical protein MMC33_003132 [Icmadophila ericetorum]|nr:hypothetical protein [Icmadophila ericetorum]